MYYFCLFNVYLCKLKINIIMEIIRTGSTSKNSEAKKFFFENYILDEKINILKTAQSLKVSRQAIYNWINEMKNK